jgi:putative ATP-dependent endonuclease of the OLD family
MHISKVRIKNFRLIKDSCLELDAENLKKLTLLIGRNNSGKTSFLILFDKFLRSATPDFDYDDFSISLRKKILNFNEETDEYDLSIRLIIDIQYTEKDTLENLSDFILDLDPNIKSVKILFECSINKKKFLKALFSIKERKEEYIKKHINNFLESKVFVFNKNSDLDPNNRNRLVQKNWKSINNLINFQVIHAKRDVASSESSQNAKKVLSNLTTSYFNKENKISHDELNAINSSIIEMDGTLDTTYLTYFADFLKNAKNFLNINDLKVISDLQSKEILSNHSKIVYGDSNTQLPEHLNGLGYMNILYLLLKIEIKKSYFTEEKKDINLLFIEEPEAHTHPQMQYVFIDKVNEILEDIPNLQTCITTHSAHIVNKCNFEDIRYLLKKENPDNIEIKNFNRDLSAKYKSDDPKKNIAEKSHFKFLKQYLTMSSSELFFAEKIIFIEGTTEKLLLPYFIKRIDDKNKNEPDYLPLSSQNISILEVGANAKAFRHFLEFLGIKTLIVTDIDTTIKTVTPQDKDPTKTTTAYPATSVNKGTHTSNYTIKYFLQAPDYKEEEKFNIWMEALKKDTLQENNSITRLAYQIEENGYHGRSFEDTFICSNIEQIKEKRTSIDGLKNTEKLDSYSDFHTLTDDVLDGKSEFASSLLWLALSEDTEWNIPLYLKNGLEWIAAK